MIHGGSRRRREMRKANSIQTTGVGSFLVKAGKGLAKPIKNVGSKVLGAGSRVAGKAKNSVRNLGPFSKAAGGTVAGIPAGEFIAEKAELPDVGGGGAGQGLAPNNGSTNGQDGDYNLGGQPPPSQTSDSGGLLPTVSSNTAINLGAYLAVGAVLAGGAVLAYRSLSSDGVRRGRPRRNRSSGRTGRGRGRNQGAGRQSNQTQRGNVQPNQQQPQGQSTGQRQTQTANTTQGGVFQ